MAVGVVVVVVVAVVVVVVLVVMVLVVVVCASASSSYCCRHCRDSRAPQQAGIAIRVASQKQVESND